MRVEDTLDKGTGAGSAPNRNISDAAPATPGIPGFIIDAPPVYNGSRGVSMGPFEWHDQDGQFVDDGIVVTGIIIAGVFLLVVSFCTVHMLRYMGFCYGVGRWRRRPHSVAEEYREYRQERLNDMYAHVRGSGGPRSGSGTDRASHGRQAHYSRLSSHPALGSRDRHERGSSSALGMDGRRNPQGNRLTYIRFSPSGIRYTNQSILMPPSGVRRHHPDRVPVLPRGGQTQPVDVQGDRAMGVPFLSSYSPWTDSMAGSSFVSQGGNGEMASGDVGADGVPLSVGSRSEDLEASVRDSATGTLLGLEASASESARARDRGIAEATAAEAARQQKIADLFVCPITHEIMEDPVMAADGYTYERKAIMQWLKAHRRSPMTNEAMVEIVLIANHGLKSAIQEWRASNEATVE
ncbi:unnamed protein product [Ostreobium quekettii]|uniref:U-box domain-containing protein n=1 Tax=Ostreobium quekettii TaxID=121088 RepID=A0A8S1JCW7_9CHLO|nr:unnamed protein product [Ostreobium quekettii]